MIRKIALAALLSTLAISGLAIGGDHRSLATERCDRSSCPQGCGSCPIPCGTSCAMDAGGANARSIAR